MEPVAVTTDQAPRSSSPLSQALRFGQFVFVSGQVPIDPQTGAMVSGDIREQTRQVMDNLRAVVEAAGSSMDKVLKTTCFLTDMDDFASFNEVYRGYFSASPPARSTVEVSRLAASFRVEVEAIACLTNGA